MQHIHFIGIGGVGMSGLAQVMLSRGVRVSGSDPHPNEATARLQAQGATMYVDQVAGNIARERPEVVVYTAAIHDDNPELAAARSSGAEVVTRAEFLGRVMAEFAGPRVAIAGTHGKTTATAMTAEVLMAGDLDPTVLIGGEYAPIGGNTRVGGDEVFLTEACEAYDSFLSLRPDLALLTNVEADHLDHYGTEAGVFEGFRRFVAAVHPGGALVWCADDPGARRLMEMLKGDGPQCRIPYGMQPHGAEGLWASEVTPDGIGTAFTAHQGESTLGTVRMRVPGTHNVLNALGALGVGLAAGLSFGAAAAGLEAFAGTGRRFEPLGEIGGVMVVDDYAHHPTEIRATLAAARAAYPERRVVAVFQPHLYSRTRDFMDGFADALAEADAVLLNDVYAAREAPIPGFRVADLARLIAGRAPDHTLLFLPDLRDIPGALSWVTRPGDLVLTLGAGDIRAVGEAFLQSGLT